MKVVLRRRIDNVEVAVLSTADADQAGGIALLWERAWKANPSPSELQDGARKVAEEIRQIDPARKALVVARNQCDTIGFCRIAVDSEDSSLWWIKGLAVRRNYRCRGIGTALLHAAAGYAREKCGEVVRSTSDPWNTASIRCHEKAGFANDGEFVAEDGDSKVGFSLRLGTKTQENRDEQ